jgi:acetyl-CoA synthetase
MNSAAVISKRLNDLHVPPNLTDYEQARSTFSWEEARRALDGLPGRGLNIAHEAIDRHADGPRGTRTALRWLGKQGEVVDLSYADLRQLTSRFANVLAGLGIGRSERVFALLGRIPELYVAALGTLRAGAVFSPLFSAFGPDPIRQRLQLGDGRVLVTTPALYEKKVAPIRDELEGLTHILLVGEGVSSVTGRGIADLAALMAAADPVCPVAETDPEDMALLHFTSGTTGTPKGAIHVHGAVVAHHATAKLALDLHPEDVFWCTADPGWVTGTSYGIIAPLTIGCTLVVDEGEFDAERWYRTLADQHVTVWYTAPTAVRMMMRLGADAPRDHDLSSLRFIASVGEPLNPEAVRWGLEAFGLAIHDNWWQTETGGIMIANFAASDVLPGSMGRPLPGITAAILEADPDGQPVLVDGHVRLLGPGAPGILALQPGWPSMFRGYLHAPERYARCFVDGWYLSGDLAQQDADGYVWFVGRADDVIKTAGHLVGPFEVESALMEHPAVAEAGVIGKPEPTIGAVIKAFVVLKGGYEPSRELRRELNAFGRRRLGAAIAPREIAFVTELPKTRSGKIMRRLLKARELGLAEGDLSTLETVS